MAAMTPTIIPGWQRYIFLSPHSPLFTLVFLCVGVGVGVGEVTGVGDMFMCDDIHCAWKGEMQASIQAPEDPERDAFGLYLVFSHIYK